MNELEPSRRRENKGKGTTEKTATREAKGKSTGAAEKTWTEEKARGTDRGAGIGPRVKRAAL